MSLRPAWLDAPATQALVRAFAPHPGSLRFVGGCVRDALVGRTGGDVDAATTLLPEAVMALLEAAGLRALPTGLAHGTVTALAAGAAFEITTLRRDVATDGRHATVAFTDDWQADAARRDFTMNALYLSPEGQLYDYTGGEADLRAGRVRFIGEPAARIAEDTLRILRFFRFHAHYGTGEADRAALAACREQAAKLEGLSAERVQHELLKLLAAPRAASAVGLMAQAGLWPHVLGGGALEEGAPTLAQLEAAPALPSPQTKLCLLSLLAGVAPDALAERLKLPVAFRRELVALAGLQAAINPGLEEAAQKRLMRRHTPARFVQAVALAMALSPQHEAAFAPMLALAAQWQPPVFPLSGEDLRARGMEEGKTLGNVLAALEEAWEASGYQLSREELLARLAP
jgi:poly(A) polymerase